MSEIKTPIIPATPTRTPIQIQPSCNVLFPINVPLGLESLIHLDHFIIKQMDIAFLEFKNKYLIADGLGRGLFTAKEETHYCSRHCFGINRPFEIEVHDLNGKEVIHFKRLLSCFSGCQSIQVYSPREALIGTVEQEWSLWTPKYDVKNANGDVVLRIEGPSWTCACCFDVELKILSVSRDTEVGRIYKKSGLLKNEAEKNFGISFPVDLDANIKGVLMGAMFLIDALLFKG